MLLASAGTQIPNRANNLMQIRSVNAEIVIQKRGFLFRPLSIVLAIGGIVILWSLMRGNLGTLVLLAVAVLFLLGLKRPLWAIAALLISQLTITSYMVSTPFGDISLRLLLLILTLLVMAREFVQKRVDLGPKTRSLLIPILVLIGVGTAANLVNSGFDFAFKDFRNMIAGLLIVVLLPAVIRNSKDLKILCSVMLSSWEWIKPPCVQTSSLVQVIPECQEWERLS
jgi:hypothetical protein